MQIKQAFSRIATLESQGQYELSDSLLEACIKIAQTVNTGGPSNLDLPLDVRVIPFDDSSLLSRELEDTNAYRRKFPRYRSPEYRSMPGSGNKAGDFGMTDAESPEDSHEQKDGDKGEKEQDSVFDINKKRKKKPKTNSVFQMNGEDSVSGPAVVVHDQTSAGMMGLDNFSWDNTRPDTSRNYERLVPHI